MIRRDLTDALVEAAGSFPAVTLTGPRQSGKTTLCRSVFSHLGYASLEESDVREFAATDPRGFLAQFTDGAVIDEVQRLPEILSYLQGAIDSDPRPGRWILTGSQNLALLESVTQSLAGRTAVMNLLPLARSEILRFERAPEALEEVLLTGGYPAIFDRQVDPAQWLSGYTAAYVERDVRTIVGVRDLSSFQRFVQLCAGRTAGLLNYSSLANDCGISQPTAKAWLSVLEASFVVFLLPSYHTSMRRRLTKMPKLHFYDTGLACWLLGIRTPQQLRSHPLRGAIFETWMVSEVLKHRMNRALTLALFHYRERSGAQLDLLLEGASRLVCFDAKSTSTPSSHLFRGVKTASSHLSKVREKILSVVVYGGETHQTRLEGDLVPWNELHESRTLSLLC